MNNLLSETMALIESAEGVNVTKMCADLDLTQRWFYLLKAGTIDDPGVKRIQKIHDYLKSRKRKAA